MTTHATATGRQIEINGASLHVDEQGSGAPILLVQPGLVSSAVYGGLVPILARDHRSSASTAAGMASRPIRAAR